MDKEIRKSLNPLFNEAYKSGKWFVSTYQWIWFHPDDLKKEHRKGQFRWGACNWRLHKPGLRRRIKRLLKKNYQDDWTWTFRI